MIYRTKNRRVGSSSAVVVNSPFGQPIRRVTFDKSQQRCRRRQIIAPVRLIAKAGLPPVPQNFKVRKVQLYLRIFVVSNGNPVATTGSRQEVFSDCAVPPAAPDLSDDSPLLLRILYPSETEQSVRHRYFLGRGVGLENVGVSDRRRAHGVLESDSRAVATFDTVHT